MTHRWLSAVGALVALLWVLAGCTGSKEAPKAPLIAAAGMKVVTLSVKGMT